MLGYIEYKVRKSQKELCRISQNQEEATVGTEAMEEEDMLDEEEAQSPTITMASKGIWLDISHCLPNSIAITIRLRTMS